VKRSFVPMVLVSLIATMVNGGNGALAQSSPPTTNPGQPAPPAPVTIVPPSAGRVAAPTDPVLISDPTAYWLLDDATEQLLMTR
jgi:hypothetical protein